MNNFNYNDIPINNITHLINKFGENGFLNILNDINNNKSSLFRICDKYNLTMEEYGTCHQIIQYGGVAAVAKGVITAAPRLASVFSRLIPKISTQLPKFTGFLKKGARSASSLITKGSKSVGRVAKQGAKSAGKVAKQGSKGSKGSKDYLNKAIEIVDALPDSAPSQPDSTEPDSAESAPPDAAEPEPEPAEPEPADSAPPEPADSAKPDEPEPKPEKAWYDIL